MAVSIIGTMASNQILGRPVFQNVLRNAAITGLAVTAAAAIPAAIEAWSLEGTTVALGTVEATRRAAAEEGFMILRVPDAIFNAVIGTVPSGWLAYNFAWIHLQYLRGANFALMSNVFDPSVMTGPYGPSIYALETVFMAYMGYFQNGRVAFRF